MAGKTLQRDLLRQATAMAMVLFVLSATQSQAEPMMTAKQAGQACVMVGAEGGGAEAVRACVERVRGQTREAWCRNHNRMLAERAGVVIDDAELARVVRRCLDYMPSD
ncbi:exported hypothetical protein [uncultured Gammaproteobacteria bacterium]